MRQGWVWFALGGLCAVPLAWAITDRLEWDNRFCVACHLDERTPLHEQKLAEFEAFPAPNLASAHRGAEPEFRCIQCHGGASLPNKVRVKLVAARDAGKWVIGRFREPDRMHHPLWDEDCALCHPSYQPAREDDYHAIADHNVIDFAYRCVDCHLAHPTSGVSPQFDFLDREVVLAICGQCHEEF